MSMKHWWNVTGMEQASTADEIYSSSTLFTHGLVWDRTQSFPVRGRQLVFRSLIGPCDAVGMTKRLQIP